MTIDPSTATAAANAEWPEILKDNSAIAEYVCDLSPYEVDAEMLEEMFHGSRARLRWVELATLILAPEESHLPSKTRQKRVDKLPISTMPPLLVCDLHLQDGYHRLRKLLKDGITHHWAYVVEDVPEPSLEVAQAPASRWDDMYNIGR